MNLTLEKLIFLLLISSCIGIVSRKLRIPYTVGLVMGGLLSAILFPSIHIDITKNLIYSLLLPPLIFESAIHIKMPELKREFPVIFSIATIGSMLSAIVVSALIYFLLDIELLQSIIIGVVLSATDPVSVIATLKESSANQRLRFLIEAESLFNDGVIVVVFGLLMALIAGSAPGIGLITILLLKSTILSITIAFTLTLLILTFIGRTSDRLIEVTLSTVCAYASFLIAEHFQGSGIIACLTAGIVFSNFGFKKAVSTETKQSLIDTWEYLGFISNSLIFIILGMQINSYNFTSYWQETILVFVFLIFGRAMAVYCCCYPLRNSALRVPFKYQNVMIWGGLRGALAIILAISLPDSLIYREMITCIVFTVVAASIILQGLTVGKVIKYSGD